MALRSAALRIAAVTHVPAAAGCMGAESPGPAMAVLYFQQPRGPLPSLAAIAAAWPRPAPGAAAAGTTPWLTDEGRPGLGIRGGGPSAGPRGRLLRNRPAATEVPLLDGRASGHTLDEHGFRLVRHALPAELDFRDASEVRAAYYPDCEALLRKETGALRAVAFEHRVLHPGPSPQADEGEFPPKRGVENEEQAELLADRCAHNDFTLGTAAARMELLARLPPEEVTFHVRDSIALRVHPCSLHKLLRGRWAFYSVWRRLGAGPPEDLPVALCDARSLRLRDLELLRVQYEDRIGERYMARYSASQRWFGFPHLTCGEAIIQKCWDSRGRDFLDPRVKFVAMGQHVGGGPFSVPATFSMGALLSRQVDAPLHRPVDRGVLEMRLLAFFE